jgi:hypothetical protein
MGQWFAGSGSNLRLETHSQNHDILSSANRLHRDLMGIRLAINHPYSNAGIPLLIDYFERNKSFLSDPILRIFFEMSLFRPILLVRFVNLNSESLNEVTSFFERAINYYEENVATNIDKAESVAVVAFLLTQQQRFYNYVIHFGRFDKSQYKQLLFENREHIKQLQQHPDYQSIAVQRQLFLALLDSYHSGPLLNFEDVKDVVLSTVGSINLENKNSQISFPTPGLLSSAKGVPFAHAIELKMQLENNPSAANALFNQAAGLYGVMIPKDAEWHCQVFPHFICRTGPDVFYTLDVILGTLMRNNLPVKGVPENTLSSQKYRNIFGDKVLVVSLRVLETGASSSTATETWNKAVLESFDEHGLIEIPIDRWYHVKGSIRRQLNGVWCSFVNKKEKIPPHPAISGVERFHVWKSNTSDPYYLWVDPVTMQVQMRINSDGTIIFPDEDSQKRWEWVNLDAVSGGRAMKALDSAAYVLQEVTAATEKEKRLILPHIKSTDGKPLEFILAKPLGINEEKWVLKGQPHLFLSTHQRLPGIHGFTNFLILESLKGNLEALIPLKSKAEMKENSVYTEWIQVKIKGDKLVTHNPRDNAYLAYITLLKASTPKDYANALEFLKNVPKCRFEGFSDEEFQMLGVVYKSKKETGDKNVYADLCRLYTAWIIHDNIKRNPVIHSVSLSQNRQIPTFRSQPQVWKDFWIN